MSAASAQTTSKPVSTSTGYRLAKKFVVPGEGHWDYIAVDSNAQRVYVSHGDVIQVLDADSGKLLGQIAAPGAHGVALASNLRRGFTSNGNDKSVTVFDMKTLAVIKTVKLEGGPDAIRFGWQGNGLCELSGQDGCRSSGPQGSNSDEDISDRPLHEPAQLIL